MALIGITETIGLVIIFLAIAFGNAAGVGGAGIIVPVLLIGFSCEMLEASALSNSMVFIAFAIRYVFNYRERHPKKDRPLIDYDTACLMLPASLFGTKLGLIVHGIFPAPVLLIFLAITLVYLSFRSVLRGMEMAKKHNKRSKALNVSVTSTTSLESMNATLIINPDELNEDDKKRLSEIMMEDAKPLPVKNAVLIVGIFVCLVVSMLIEGGKGLDSIFGVEICSPVYWTSIFIFGAICTFVTYTIGKDIFALTDEKKRLHYTFAPDDVKWSWRTIIEYSCYGLFAGILSAIFGIGGGMILAPVLVQLKMLPEVVSATGGVFVLITTAASSVILISEGYWHLGYGIITASVSLTASLASIYAVAGLLKKYGKPYIIIYIMAGVIYVSGVVITGVGLYQEHDKYGSLLSPKLWRFRNYCQE